MSSFTCRLPFHRLAFAERNYARFAQSNLNQYFCHSYDRSASVGDIVQHQRWSG